MEIFKIAVYPYSPEIDPVLRYIHFLMPQYEIKSLISPKGWGYVNKTIYLGKSTSEKSIIVKSSLNDLDKEINCILIPEFESTKEFKSNLIDNISNLMPGITKIICDAHLNEVNLKKLQEICISSNNACTLNIRNKIKTECDYNLQIQEDDETLENIPAPIIAVAGMGENLDKFHTSLVLRDVFQENGYKISQIGSRSYCEILGFHSFPGFMFNPEIDESKKVILFNRYIKQIYDTEKPDIIIIGVPGTIQGYNSKFTQRFGILHYLVFKAIISDFIVMCTFYETNGIEFLKLISQSCFYKFGCYANCFHMSNKTINFIEMEGRGIFKYINLPRKKVTEILSKNYTESPVPVVNLLDESGILELYEKIINKLTGN